LLHNSVYVEAFSGIDSDWSGWQLFVLLAASSVVMMSMWLALSSLAEREGPGSVTVSLSLSIMTAGLAIMLSGYIKGGVAGFPIAASLMGVVMVNSIAGPENYASNGRSFQSVIGFGITALFGLLWIGSFFGRLRAVEAVTIFLAPSLCWVSEFPVFRQMKRRHRMVLRLFAVAIPLAFQLFNAKRAFDQKLGSLVAGVTESSFGF
jgi:hypothetical protein